jgi:hypothetical protein
MQLPPHSAEVNTLLAEANARELYTELTPLVVEAIFTDDYETMVLLEEGLDRTGRYVDLVILLREALAQHITEEERQKLAGNSPAKKIVFLLRSGAVAEDELRRRTSSKMSEEEYRVTRSWLQEHGIVAPRQVDWTVLGLALTPKGRRVK